MTQSPQANAPAPSARLGRCRAFLIDMDGTLYLDERLLPGAKDVLAHLEARGVPYLLVTNNSSRRGEDYRLRLERLGVTVERSRVLTSGDATISYLLEKTPYRSAYVVGTPGLEDDFRQRGIALDEEDPDCVVVGYDSTLTYHKLEVACRLLMAGKPYMATHPDKTCITERGLIPDVAAILAACEAVTGRAPDHILGKPSQEMVAIALERLGADADHTAIIGDQLDTDMAMGIDGGLVSVLVMTGETSLAKLAGWPKDRRPTLVASDMDQVLSWLT